MFIYKLTLHQKVYFYFPGHDMCSNDSLAFVECTLCNRNTSFVYSSCVIKCQITLPLP